MRMIGYKIKKYEDKNEVLTFVLDKIDLCPTYSPF